MRWIFFAAALFGLDFTTKFITVLWGPPNIAFSFLGIDFSWVLTLNRGAAWGMFSSYQGPLIFFRICLIASLIIYIFFFNKELRLRFSFFLIVVGAFSNVVDYFIYGHVVDMFHFIFWGWDYPVFNVADSAIFLGVVSLIGLSWKK